MAKTYAQIQKQIEGLQKEAEKLRRGEVDAVVARIKEAIAVYGLTAEDLGLARAPKAAKVAKAVKPRRARAAAPQARTAKYRDPDGNEWSGRGPRPKWLRAAIEAGRSIDEFAV